MSEIVTPENIPVTIVLPVHEINDEIEKLLEKALKSVEQQSKVGDDRPPVLIVYSYKIKDEVKEFINGIDFPHLNIKLIENTEDTSYQGQVNVGVSNVETEYFSILELDDEYHERYFFNVMKYIKKMPDAELFIPVILEVTPEQKPVKMTNQTVWSRDMVGENGTVGVLNLNLINKHSDFKLCGCVMKKDEFENIGGYKSKIELAFNYEILLRALHNGSTIVNIPKMGYKHMIDRPNSLFMGIAATMNVQERAFWFQTAQKECYFFNDRDIDKSQITNTVVPAQQ